MAKKLQLSIPEPCHENWDVMTPVEKGRFCNSCQKQVVDFSRMSDRQVAEFFKKPSTGSVCGRFMTDQLERDIDIPKKRIPWFKYFFQFALPAFLVSLKATSARSQGIIDIRTTNVNPAKKPSPLSSNLVKPPTPICTRNFFIQPVDTTKEAEKVRINMGKPRASFDFNKELVADTIRGIIVDDKQQPIPFASILIKGTRQGYMADANGEFVVKPFAAWDKIVLIGSSVGMINTEFAIDKSMLDQPVVLRMQPMEISYDVGVIIVTHKKLKKSNTPVIPDLPSTPSAFTVFPNPVDAGASLTIEWKQKEEGYYTLQLLDISGRSVHQQEIWIDADAKLLSIDLPEVTAGNYFVVLTNKKTKKKATEKLLIR